MIERQPNDRPEPPTILYKYLPPDRIDILENMQLRFSRPTDFNDTFDSDFLVPKSQGIGAKAARYHLKNQLGVLCLTEKADNHLMWVHYAKNHTGFILGFNTHVPFFSEKNRILRKVTYQNRPDVLSNADLNVCFYKSDAWKFEREWRCVRSFQPSEPRMEAIEPELVSQIIFGSRMEPWQKARIVSYVTGYGMKDAQLFLSSPSRKSWTFENEPKTMSLCTKCDGNGYLVEDLPTEDHKIGNH
jgi:hypothetical protein